MKKKFSKIILCCCLIFLLFSCDGSFNSFLNALNGNLYLDTGLISPDISITENFATQDSTVTDHANGDREQTIGKDDNKITITTNKENNTGSIEIGGNKITITDADSKYIDKINNGITPPMTPEGYNDFAKEMTDSLASASKSEAYIENLRTEVKKEDQDSIKGTFAVTALVAKEAAKNLADSGNQELVGVLESVANLSDDVINSDKLTNADKYTAQLIVSIVTEATTMTEENKDQVQKNIINQATTLLQLSKQEAGNFDIAKAIDLDSILSGLGGGQQGPQPEAPVTRSMNGNQESTEAPNFEQYLPTVRTLLTQLFGYDAKAQAFDQTKFERTLSSYKAMEVASRLIIANTLKDADLVEHFSVTKTIDYALSFVIYQLDEVNVRLKNAGYQLYDLATEFVNANSWIINGNEEIKEEMVLPENVKKAFEVVLDKTITDHIAPTDIINDGAKAIIKKSALLSQAESVDRVIKTIKAFPTDFSFKEYIEGMLSEGQN